MMRLLPKIYQYTFVFYCFFIPFTDFGEAIPNILLAIMGSMFLFVVKKNDLQKLKNYSIFIFIGLIALTLIQTILLNRSEDFNFITRLFIVPVILILHLPIKNHKPSIYGFLLGVLILTVIASLNIGKIYLSNGALDFTGEEVNEIILGERPYLGFICVTAFCLSIYFGINQFRVNKTKSTLLFIVAALFFGFIFTISARISLISIAIIGLYYLVTLKSKISKYVLMISALFVFYSIFLINKDLRKRFFITENSYTLKETLKFEPRYHIWNCSYYLIKEKPLIGWGLRESNSKLQDCYSKSENFIDKEQQDYYVRSSFNTHNQFLNFFLGQGLVAFLTFLSFFGVCFYQYRKSPISIALLIGLFLFCCVENVLSRQIGASLFALVFIASNNLSFKPKA